MARRRNPSNFPPNFSTIGPSSAKSARGLFYLICKKVFFIIASVWKVSMNKEERELFGLVCSSCGVENGDLSNFCTNCGKVLPPSKIATEKEKLEHNQCWLACGKFSHAYQINYTNFNFCGVCVVCN